MINKKQIRENLILNDLDINSDNINTEFVIKANKKKIDGKEVLFIYLYKNLKLVLILVFDGKEYITAKINDRYLNGIQWLTGKISTTLNDFSWYRVPSNEFITNKESALIRKYLKLNDKPNEILYSIENFQRNILYKKLKEKHKEETDLIDNAMSKIRKIPQYFKDYVEYKYFAERYMLYEYSSKKYNTCTCTNCNQDIQILSSEIKQGKEYKCPNCNADVIFISRKKTRLIERDGNIAFYQKTKDNNIVLREFYVTKKIDTRENKSTMSFHEAVRTINKKNGFYNKYYWGNFKQTGELRWCDSKYSISTNTYLYKDNLKDVIKNTVYKYSYIDTYLKNNSTSMFYGSEFRDYVDHPEIEVFNKLGLYGLTSNIKRIKQDKKQTKILKKLGITKYEFELLKNTEESKQFNSLEMLQILNSVNYRIPGEIYSDVYNKIYSEMSSELFKYITSISNLKKLFNYMLSLNSEDFHLLKDYIRMCKQNNIELTKEIVYVKNLKVAHDEMVEIINKKKYEKYDEDIIEVYKDFNKVIYSNEKYSIIKPDIASEIALEGVKLDHCVASYIENVINNRCLIFFLRENTNINKPFYTLEWKRNTIAQCRGYKNKNTTDEIKVFLEKFKDYMHDTLQEAI